MTIAEKLILSVTLHIIIIPAKHLQIFKCCLATTAPWDNVVTFHFCKIKMLLADRTNTALFFIGLAFHFFIKLPKTQMTFLAVKKIIVNTLVICNFFIVNKRNNFFFKFTANTMIS